MIPVDLSKVKSAFDTAIQQNGVDCTFTLRSGETFTIKGFLRFQREELLTEGMNQDRRKLSFMEDRWRVEAPIGRDPEKGDQVVVSGRRFAIEEADPQLFQDVVIGWRVRLMG